MSHLCMSGLRGYHFKNIVIYIEITIFIEF
jgi:hypothetical protein